jgi:hypothetical protein
MDYAANDLGYTIDMALRNDIVSGRKRLDEALAERLTPTGKVHLAWLKSRYGEPPAKPAKGPPEKPPVVYRDVKTNYQVQWQPLPVFLKYLDGEPLSTDLSARPGLEPLFPNNLDEYIKRAAKFIKSETMREREYGFYCLEHRFNWTFEMDVDDPTPLLVRKLEEMRPLLDQMGKGTLVEARGTLLVHFGVKLEGPPGKKWMPALEKAACSWNPTICFNATRVLCTLTGDSDLMRYPSMTINKREKELKAQLASGTMYQAPNFGKEPKPLAPDLARKYRDDLNSGDPETAVRAMKELVSYPQSTLAFLRKELRVPPEPDAKRCAVLIADLGSATFKTRNQASEELKKLGEGVVPHLQRELDKKLQVEMRRRIEEVVEFHVQGRAGMLRSLQVLETLPGPAARFFLEELAAGPEQAILTREARASLRRLDLYWQW